MESGQRSDGNVRYVLYFQNHFKVSYFILKLVGGTGGFKQGGERLRLQSSYFGKVWRTDLRGDNVNEEKQLGGSFYIPDKRC